jgi:hypothetical protein
MFCHPEPGVSRVRDRTTVISREVVGQIVTLPAAFPFLLAVFVLLSDVRRLAPASPPLKMTWKILHFLDAVLYT